MRYLPEPPIAPGTPEHTAILLVNLGSPDAPTAPALRRYLREFLSDQRVVEIPRLLWWPILNGIILNTRPAKSAAKYASVWTNEGSPLRVHTERLAKLLKGALGEAACPVEVVWAMRYGTPSVGDTIERLRADNCRRILVVPLYPQYAAATSSSVVDAVCAHLLRLRRQPELRTLGSFPEDPGYIAALAQSVRDAWKQHGQPDEKTRLLISFHGLPEESRRRGDPYPDECQATAARLAAALALPAGRVLVTFQSRFGPADWLKPYTAATLEALPKEGVDRVDVLCPGFVADCLETLEEIAMEGRATFLEAGGKTYNYIPCLNERADWVAALRELVVAQLAGWGES